MANEQSEVKDATNQRDVQLHVIDLEHTIANMKNKEADLTFQLKAVHWGLKGAAAAVGVGAGIMSGLYGDPSTIYSKNHQSLAFWDTLMGMYGYVLLHFSASLTSGKESSGLDYVTSLAIDTAKYLPFGYGIGCILKNHHLM
ncbi:MAG: hypothetical protein V1743_05205 [Nanoarchaeota archaeon]